MSLFLIPVAENKKQVIPVHFPVELSGTFGTPRSHSKDKDEESTSKPQNLVADLIEILSAFKNKKLNEITGTELSPFLCQPGIPKIHALVKKIKDEVVHLRRLRVQHRPQTEKQLIVSLVSEYTFQLKKEIDRRIMKLKSQEILSKQNDIL